MPREQVEWYVQQPLHETDRIHAHQSCTYYSAININKTKNPFTNSFEHEQTWTYTQTISNNNKRYQSSIDNIHLTTPAALNIIAKTKSQYMMDDEKEKQNCLSSHLPPLPPTRQHALPYYRFNRTNIEGKNCQQKSMKIDQINSVIENCHPIKNSMRIIRTKGEFVVRI